MNAVKAKFVCQSTQRDGGLEEVRLSPVTDGSEEDNTFSKYTPSGLLELSITNENVFGFFEVGKKYYLDITPADVD